MTYRVEKLAEMDDPLSVGMAARRETLQHKQQHPKTLMTAVDSIAFSTWNDGFSEL